MFTRAAEPIERAGRHFEEIWNLGQQVTHLDFDRVLVEETKRKESDKKQRFVARHGASKGSTSSGQPSSWQLPEREAGSMRAGRLLRSSLCSLPFLPFRWGECPNSGSLAGGWSAFGVA